MAGHHNLPLTLSLFAETESKTYLNRRSILEITCKDQSKMGVQSTNMEPRRSLAQNKTKKILEDAEKGGYGIIASIV
jgi:N-dimethylarginine dimethylaminohydrolase